MEVGVKFRYAFQAVRGDPSSSAGGIYIDDISLSETRCPNAVWRIQNFSKIMETATTDTVLFSPRFYSPEGYGYGVLVVPLSTHTDYTGNYTGLYFHLASGENDAALQWPVLNRQATLVVMDQDPDIKLRMSTARSLTTDMRSEFLPSKKKKKKNRHITRNANSYDSCDNVTTDQNSSDIFILQQVRKSMSVCFVSSSIKWKVGVGQSVQSGDVRSVL